ncbi:hypothetical protein DY245_08230 [Streptomyces inhibens]|uniref:Uncharacterized protein n=1 Tax=Streptomyces inhibens TaxID=2293571 RepID=A0A371Q7Z8_STRIH|nr:hypothetical protein [Streptomyces inhibens]REK90820.1 hypothetical protein DY245_08230 [Streptomyces inhibens]
MTQESDDARDVDPLTAFLGSAFTTAYAIAAPAAGENPFARATRSWGLSAIGMAESALRACGVSSAKGALAQGKVALGNVALGLDLDAYDPSDYDAVADQLEPLEALLDALPTDENGMRWRHADGAVLFACERTVSVPYDEFVSRVDISQAIRLTADYLGGCVVPVDRDEAGRIIRQAERSIALPQPNYLAFFGADMLDVCKLESICRTAGAQCLSWCAVRSPNDSAVLDDGSVTFARADGGARTKIVIRTHQQFTLPLFLRMVDFDAWPGVPGVKNLLVEDAYRRFFTTTLDNFEACYQGRLLGTGSGRDEGRPRPLRGAACPDHVDANGFRHFAAVRPRARILTAVPGSTHRPPTNC